MMPEFQIVEAKRHHLGIMARRLRGEHRAAMIGLGMNIHRDMTTAFEHSCYRKAWLIDGDLAAIGGVMGSALASSGFVWLALSDGAAKFPFAVAREIRRQINTAFQTRSELAATSICGDINAGRLLRWLGFEPNGELSGTQMNILRRAVA